MPKKSQIKKRQFQSMCRANVKKGLINRPDGTWRPASDHTMDQHMLKGYRLS